MPVYRGRCPEHGVFERTHRISERELDADGYTVVRCPECGEGFGTIPCAPALHSDEGGGMSIGAQPGTREYELSQTRSGMKKLIDEIQARNPGKQVKVEPPGQSRRIEADERQHELWRRRKAAGRDLKTHAQVSAAKKAAKREAETLAHEKRATVTQAKALVKEKVSRRIEDG